MPHVAMARSAAMRFYHFVCLSLVASTQLQAQTLPKAAPSSPSTTVCGKLGSYDAIVVGAGIAGLTAAKELTHLGRKVLVLESNNRIGGRGFVGEIGPGKVPIDYGGAWIHGVSTNPLTGLVDGAGYKRARTDLSTRVFLNGKWLDEEEAKNFDKVHEEFEETMVRVSQAVQNERAISEFACSAFKEKKSQKEICDELSTMFPSGKALQQTDLCTEDKSLKPDQYCRLARQVLERTSDNSLDWVPDSKYRPLMVANAGPLESAQELARTSVVEGSAFEAGEDDLVATGLGTFVQSLGKDLPVCINSPVSAVRYSTRGVEVDAAGTTYKAKTALVTVSVGVLQAKRIAFTPELPEAKLNAIKTLQMGQMQKVIIPFNHDIFPKDAINAWALYEGKIPDEAKEFAQNLPQNDGKLVMGFVFKPLQKPIAIGFFGGRWAEALEARCARNSSKHTSGLYTPGDCDDLAVKIAQAALIEMFGENAKTDALTNQIQLTHWSLDETSLGAYSVAAPGTWKEHEILALPVADACKTARVFFGGEGTARPIYNGSYPGAYESGLKAAREMSNVLGELPTTGVSSCPKP